MRKYAIALALCAALWPVWPPNTARADDVGAVIGGLSGLVIAGPPGAVIGAVVGWVFGKPFWGEHRRDACWIDETFVRRCPADYSK